MCDKVGSDLSETSPSRVVEVRGIVWGVLELLDQGASARDKWSDE